MHFEQQLVLITDMLLHC